MELQEIRTQKEDQTFDFKSIQIAPKVLAITIVAFANADGGDIAVGVSDKTRKIEGGWPAYGKVEWATACSFGFL